MKITPLHSNVVISLDDPPKVKGRIHLPDGAVSNSGYATGTVLAVGPGYDQHYLNHGGLTETRHISPGVKVGDKVVLTAYNSERTMDFDGARVMVCEEHTLLGKITE